MIDDPDDLAGGLLEGVVPVRSAAVVAGRLGLDVETDIWAKLTFETGDELTVHRDDGDDVTGEAVAVQIERGVTIWLDTRPTLTERGRRREVGEGVRP